MKKTLTINLGGTVFHIDEDAYLLLDKYLSNLRIHFKHEEGSDEIMDDFERRISELFGERIKLGHEVITVVEVEDVIKRMGKPEELFEESSADHQERSVETGTKEKQGGSRRLFRNPDDRMIGGVAGGLSAYLGWDSSVVRITLFLFLFISHGVVIPLYLLLWIVMPEAKTASEKLQMHGKSVTVENIGKTVTDGFEKVSQHVAESDKPDKPRSAFQRILDVFVAIVGVFLKVFLILIAILLFPPLLLVVFVLVVVLFALVFGGGMGLLYTILPGMHWNSFETYPEIALILGSLSTILLIGIPIVAVAYMIMSLLFNLKPMSSGVKWTFLILWVIAVVMSVIFAAKYGMPFWGNWTPWDAGWNTIQWVL